MLRYINGATYLNYKNIKTSGNRKIQYQSTEDFQYLLKRVN